MRIAIAAVQFWRFFVAAASLPCLRLRVPWKTWLLLWPAATWLPLRRAVSTCCINRFGRSLSTHSKVGRCESRDFFLINEFFFPDGSTLSYSRLDVNATREVTKARRLIGLFNKAASQTYQCIPKSISKTSQLNKEVEREWLLLGEPPSSPRVSEAPPDVESTILSDPSTSDIECIAKPQSDTESTTDIDAIVDEYRQKVKVSTVGPPERLPSPGSWWIAIFLLLLVVGSSILTGIGVLHDNRPLYAAGPTLVLIAGITLHILPKYQTSSSHPPPLVCTLATLAALFQLTVILNRCWGPLAFWFTAAVIFYVRCDVYICACIEQHPSNDNMTEVLISGDSGRHKLSMPPVPDMSTRRVSVHRWHIDSSESEEDYEEDTIEEWTE